MFSFILGIIVGIALVFIVSLVIVRKKFGINNKSLELEDLFSEEEFDFKQSDFED